MSETTYRCPNCAGNVQFNPGEQKLTCPYCNHSIDIEGLKQPAYQQELDFVDALERFEQLSTEEVRVVKCTACGAETTFAPNVDSGPCDFCGTAIVVTGSTTKAMKPQYVMPFKIKMEQAETSFRTWLKKRWFAPNALKALARIEDPLKGIYFPFWTYDSDTETHYIGERGEHYVVEVREKNSNGEEVTREEIRTRWYPAAGVVNRFFDDILVPASHSIPPTLTSNLSTWKLSELAEYNPAIFSGFKSETYSISLKDGFETAQGEMKSQIERDVRHHIGGDEQRIFSMNTRYSKITFKYIQLPVWTLMYRFKQRFFQVVVNGQTGEVSGERPYSVIKILLAILAGLVVVAGGFLIYSYFNV